MRVRSLLLTLAVLATLAGIAPAQAAPPKPLELTMSNFRYCAKKVCEGTDQAYLADQRTGAPIGNQFNPKGGFPKVKPGQTVVWTYRDKGTPTSCDNYKTAPLNCEGHAVKIVGGKRVGFVPSRKGEGKITWTVPATAKPGSRIAYFCDVPQHAFPLGMTGALDVVK
jgi:hypothetical protein